jgi:hypothetical protein
MFTVELVHIADLTAGVELEFGEGSAKQNGVEKLGAHVGILQLENVAYSILPEIFVNDLSYGRALSLCIPLKEKVLTSVRVLRSGF